MVIILYYECCFLVYHYHNIIIVVGLCSCIILCEPSPPYRGSGDRHVTVSPDLSCADSYRVLCAKNIYRVVNCSKVSIY